MKKLFALILVCMLCLTTAYAAEWGEGLGPAKPYSGVPEFNLNESIGFIMRYPQEKLPAERFCDILEIYFPREDIALGDGTLTLYDENGQVASISFADEQAVELRPLEEVELEGLMWGGGVCIGIHLPVSLRLDGSYYVNMEANCFTAADGAVKSPAYGGSNPWVPVVTGDYGIGGLCYSGEDGEPKYAAEVGDTITFDVTLGGDAKSAVVYSENDSVYFEELEYTESRTVTGTVTGDEISWGIVFLNEDNDVVDQLQLGF